MSSSTDRLLHQADYDPPAYGATASAATTSAAAAAPASPASASASSASSAAASSPATTSPRRRSLTDGALNDLDLPAFRDAFDDSCFEAVVGCFPSQRTNAVDLRLRHSVTGRPIANGAECLSSALDVPPRISFTPPPRPGLQHDRPSSLSDRRYFAVLAVSVSQSKTTATTKTTKTTKATKATKTTKATKPPLQRPLLCVLNLNPLTWMEEGVVTLEPSVTQRPQSLLGSTVVGWQQPVPRRGQTQQVFVFVFEQNGFVSAANAVPPARQAFTVKAFMRQHSLGESPLGALGTRVRGDVSGCGAGEQCCACTIC